MIDPVILPVSTDYTASDIVHVYPDGRIARMMWEDVVVIEAAPTPSEPKGEEVKS